MSFEFTEKTEATLTAAIQLAKDYANSQVQPVHFASVMLNEESTPAPPGAMPKPNASTHGTSLLVQAIQKAGGDQTAFNRAIQKQLVRLPAQDPPPDDISLSQASRRVLQEAQTLQKTMHDSYLAQDHLLLALIKDSTIAQALKEASLNENVLKTVLQQIRGNRRVESKSAEQGFDALSKYATDLTALAEEGKLDPVIGRDNEIRRVIRILCRRTKNNPVLIGEPGVGKTAIAEGLAIRMARRDVPASLMGRLFSLDMGALMAGAKYKGEYEERVKSVLNEVEKASEDGVGVILFIDELHLIMAGKGAEGGGMDAANLLKPQLARGKIRVIGATTLAEYSKYIEKDAAFERRFAQVIVNEPTVADTISILRGIREKYEVHHGVRILDGALVAAASLAHRYLTSRRLPDSAIDLVDECCASVRVARETAPEAIDLLERKRLELDVEVHALEREKDASSKERLAAARKEIANIDDQLQPLKAQYETEKKRADNINEMRKRLDELKAKADDAERRYDLATASDLRYYAIPELQSRIEKAQAEETAQGVSIQDTVTPEAIAEVVGRWTSIPVTRLLSTEKEKLLKLEKVLSENVVGQPEAVKAVANAIRLSRSGLKPEGRPLASFLFAGPSGTGKTLLSKTLAQTLFDSPDAMCRIDGSEYSEKHSISRLIGAPPGYVGHDSGGQLTEYIRRKPYSVILVDELEKASKEFVTIFLQVLDDGRLTDGQGRLVDFRNTVIIFTSNVGSAFLTAMGEGPVPDKIRNSVMNAIRSTWPPEFLNRVDSIIIYRALSRSNLRKIVDLRLREVQERLDAKKMTLSLNEEAKDYLTSIGYSPTYGARPLQRTITTELLNPLSVYILDDRVRDGETVRVELDRHHNRLAIIPNHEGSGAGDDMELDYDEEGPVVEEMD